MAAEAGKVYSETAAVLNNERIGPGYRVMLLESRDIARAAKPGQFVHLRVPGPGAHILRRPFSIFRTDAAGTLSILYKRVGQGTEIMQGIGTGDRVNIIGPLGNGYPSVREGTFPILVAGGYGIAALYLVAVRSPVVGVMLAGARTAEEVVCVGDVEGVGWPVHVATEDGSRGRRGMVTDLLGEFLSNEKLSGTPELFVCGPDGMLRAVCKMARSIGCKAWLSLDRRMGCGVGACLACVQNIRQEDGSIRRKRTCVDGPVFECREIVWGKV